MTRAPMGSVSALRETSVLFAVLLGRIVLRRNFDGPPDCFGAGDRGGSAVPGMTALKKFAAAILALLATLSLAGFLGGSFWPVLLRRVQSSLPVQSGASHALACDGRGRPRFICWVDRTRRRPM